MLAILAVFNVKTVLEIEVREPDRGPRHRPAVVVGYRYDTNNDGTVDIITATQVVVPVGHDVR